MAPLQIVKDLLKTQRLWCVSTLKEGYTCLFAVTSCQIATISLDELGELPLSEAYHEIIRSSLYTSVEVPWYFAVVPFNLENLKWTDGNPSPLSNLTVFPRNTLSLPAAISSYHKWNIAGNSSICRCVWFPSFIEQQFPLLCWIPGGQQTPPVTLDLGSKVLRNMISGNLAGGNLWIFPHVCMQ